jgi:hypothetical protein
MRNLEMVALELEELMASKAVIEAKIEAARNEIIKSIETDKLTLIKIGKFTVNLRNDKVWTYSKWVRTLEKMLKTRKENEQKNDIATHELRPTWRFVLSK